VRGNLDALAFFSTSDLAQAEAIARRDGIDLVLMCHDVPRMYTSGNGSGVQPKDTFTGQIAAGKIPNWLKEIPVPEPTDFSLFEVK
jgi:hypothetical protein